MEYSVFGMGIDGVRLRSKITPYSSSYFPADFSWRADSTCFLYILKFLLIVAIQYNSIGLINIQYRCDYTRAHAGHVVL
jgi:hypothetical protein